MNGGDAGRRNDKDIKGMKSGTSGRGGPRRGWLLAVAALIAVSIGLSACGRKNAPEYPEGAEYPKTYPVE